MALPQLIAVVGPTASGKTGLSIELAKLIDGEVISADSRQVYKGLDIGTEKVTEQEMQDIPHYCIDIASPKRAFSVAQWKKHAQKAVQAIYKRGHTPVVTGGSGQYVDALVYNLDFPSVPPNARLRAHLEKCSVDQLFARLQKVDPVRAKTIEAKNPRRLVRALEIAEALGSVPSVSNKQPVFDAMWIGLFPGMDKLASRIKRRLDTTLRKGLLEEVHTLRANGLSYKRMCELGLEYRIAAEYLQSKITEQEMKDRMFIELRQYAKRQMTWFRRNKSIVWYTDAAHALLEFKETVEK